MNMDMDIVNLPKDIHYALALPFPKDIHYAFAPPFPKDIHYALAPPFPKVEVKAH